MDETSGPINRWEVKADIMNQFKENQRWFFKLFESEHLNWFFSSHQWNLQWWLLIGLSRRDVVEPIWVDSFQWECNSCLWEDCTLSGREGVEPIKSYKTASVWINNPTWLGYRINTHTHTLIPASQSLFFSSEHMAFTILTKYVLIK